jgi:hypothetical protein
LVSLKVVAFRIVFSSALPVAKLRDLSTISFLFLETDAANHPREQYRSEKVKHIITHR